MILAYYLLSVDGKREPRYAHSVVGERLGDLVPLGLAQPHLLLGLLACGDLLRRQRNRLGQE